MKLTDDHLQTFVEQGFVAVEDFYPEQRRAQIAAAIRRTLPPWKTLADDPPTERLLRDDFPYADTFFNEFIIDWDLIEFVQRVLDTEDIHFRYAHNWARYPDPGAAQPGLHIDNGNNSLLPPTSDRRYGQISTWYFPEAVDENQAPMQIVPKPYGQDLSKRVLLTVPAGTIMIFNTHLWHSGDRVQGLRGATLFRHPDLRSRRPLLGGRGAALTNLGMNEHFRAFIGRLSARERALFRFPPPGHEYYIQEDAGPPRRAVIRAGMREENTIYERRKPRCSHRGYHWSQRAEIFTRAGNRDLRSS